jgi:hypothetical protein
VVRVSLFVWLLPLDLTGMGGPTSSYATAGIAFRVSGALKPHHHDKVEISLVGKCIMTPSVPNSVPLFIRRPPECGVNVTLHTVHHHRNIYGVLNPLPSSGISDGKFVLSWVC